MILVVEQLKMSCVISVSAQPLHAFLFIMFFFHSLSLSLLSLCQSGFCSFFSLSSLCHGWPGKVKSSCVDSHHHYSLCVFTSTCDYRPLLFLPCILSQYSPRLNTHIHLRTYTYANTQTHTHVHTHAYVFFSSIIH